MILQQPAQRIQFWRLFGSRTCPPTQRNPRQAASGMIAANALAPVWSHLQALDELKL